MRKNKLTILGIALAGILTSSAISGQASKGFQRFKRIETKPQLQELQIGDSVALSCEICESIITQELSAVEELKAFIDLDKPKTCLACAAPFSQRHGSSDTENDELILENQEHGKQLVISVQKR
ncbi:hypothetical protein [Pelagicoccus sp. SDUM812003]|uniref:hypothetical protein n=1 Tax=Pelagicoccus sp. SDUM812003 TaxID=3041267 RepID=UPI00280F7CF3|nr:hypothetical protein [Pelagicoccus sp. SDUM812003]MDQ8202208.1 hypothetical protein [Pelagicoccus sp. SDUM812003]